MLQLVLCCSSVARHRFTALPLGAAALRPLCAPEGQQLSTPCALNPRPSLHTWRMRRPLSDPCLMALASQTAAPASGGWGMLVGGRTARPLPPAVLRACSPMQPERITCAQQKVWAGMCAFL